MTDKPRGRPRKHPATVTPADRASMSRQRVIDAGGKRITMILSPEVNAALTTIRNYTSETETECVHRIILENAEVVERRTK